MNTALENIGRFKEFSSEFLLSKLSNLGKMMLSADSFLLCSTKHRGTAGAGTCGSFSLRERLLFIAFLFKIQDIEIIHGR